MVAIGSLPALGGGSGWNSGAGCCWLLFFSVSESGENESGASFLLCYSCVGEMAVGTLEGSEQFGGSEERGESAVPSLRPMLTRIISFNITEV